MATTYNVTKAKLKGNYLELEMEETVDTPDGLTATNEISKKCNVLVHPDLLKAMDALTFHLIVIAGQKGDEVLKNVGPNDALVSNYTKDFGTTGYSIGGHDEYLGVTLIGYKKFASGKKLNLCTPFTMFADENDQYDYADELKEDISRVEAEIMLYLSGEKTGCNKQLDMFAQQAMEVSGADMVRITATGPDGQSHTMTLDTLMEKNINVIKKGGSYDDMYSLTDIGMKKEHKTSHREWQRETEN